MKQQAGVSNGNICIPSFGKKKKKNNPYIQNELEKLAERRRPDPVAAELRAASKSLLVQVEMFPLCRLLWCLIWCLILELLIASEVEAMC